MTKERIEIVRQVLIPFVKKELLKINYEGLGKSDAEEFENDLNEILDLSIKALEQQPSDCKIFGNKENCFGGAAEKECNHCDYKRTAEQQSIEDCVSRKAVFETIDDCNSDGLKGIFCSYDDGERFKEYVKMLPPVTPTQRWIPVSEELPKKNMPCLVSVGSLNLTEIAMYSDLMGTIDHKIFWQGDYGHENFSDITKYVKAWMLLPKPYEEKRGSEDGSN